MIKMLLMLLEKKIYEVNSTAVALKKNITSFWVSFWRSNRICFGGCTLIFFYYLVSVKEKQLLSNFFVSKNAISSIADNHETQKLNY